MFLHPKALFLKFTLLVLQQMFFSSLFEKILTCSLILYIYIIQNYTRLASSNMYLVVCTFAYYPFWGLAHIVLC